VITGKRMRCWTLVVCLIPVVSLFIVTSSCGSASLHLPHVTVTSFGGPRSYEWTITTASHGSGFGFSALVVQYPDGHRRVWGGTLLQDSASGSAVFNSFKDMAPGHYRYFVYAVPTSPKLTWYFVSTRDQVAKNLVASGSFSIP